MRSTLVAFLACSGLSLAWASLSMSYGRAADPRIMMDKIVDIEKPFHGDTKDLLEYIGGSL